jgi:hypothetical protein
MGGDSREQAPESSAEQDDVISRVDGARERGLVGIEIAKHVREEGVGRRGASIGRGLGVAVELEQLGE